MLNTDITVQTNLELDKIDWCWIGDSYEAPYDLISIQYDLYDYSGVLVDTLFVDFGVYDDLNITGTETNQLIAFDPFPYRYSTNKLINIGDYVIKTTIIINKIQKCILTDVIRTCEFFSVELNNCNKYTIKNHSVDSLDVVISKLTDNTFVDVTTGTVGSLSNLDIEHTVDGVYKYAVTRDGVTKYLIIPTYCNLEACLLNIINKIVCGKKACCDDCEEHDYYDANAVIMMAHMYFSKLNKLFSYNNILDSFDMSALDNLREIQAYLEKAKDYCDACVKVDVDCGCK